MHADTRTAGDVLTDRYVLERRLGSGGAAVVWRAHDRVLQRSVAVKLLHPELAHDPATAARFRSEASSAAKLTHPNAVIVYDIGRDRGRDFLVMELVDGPVLADLMAEGPLSPTRVAGIGAAVASALGLAHQRGMLHRDVKPANVLLTEDGIPKVADFGIARALGEASARLTTPGSVMGTARYLAPEQLLDGPLDGRVDVYALGLVLHEALTGQAPWGGGTALEIASRRLNGDLRPPSTLRSDVPPGLDAVVQRATRREPDERFADGTAMAAALAQLTGARVRHDLRPRPRSAPSNVRVATPPASRGAARSTAPTSRSNAPSRPAPPHPAPRTAGPGDTAVPGASRRAPARAVPDHRQRDPDAVGSTATRTAPAGEKRRSRRARRRAGRLVIVVSLIGVMAFVGAQLPIPGSAELIEWVQDSELDDFLREVRDGVSELLPR